MDKFSRERVDDDFSELRLSHVSRSAISAIFAKAATVLLAADVPLEVVSELLGHSSVAITADIYADALPEQQQEVVRTMDDL